MCSTPRTAALLSIWVGRRAVPQLCDLTGKINMCIKLNLPLCGSIYPMAFAPVTSDIRFIRRKGCVLKVLEYAVFPLLLGMQNGEKVP